MISSEMTDLEVSLEASIPQYNEFYKNFGIRTASQLINLRDNKLDGFVMPLYSTLHYTLRDNVAFGITEEDPLLVNMGDRIAFDAVGYYGDHLIGNPVKKQRLLVKEIKAFVAKNRRFKFIESNKALEEIRVVPKVVSYSSIDESYRYKAGEGTYFQRRYNYFSTVIDGLVNELKTSARHQFLMMEVPSTIPPVSKLREAEARWLLNVGKPVPLDKQRRDNFATDGRFWILQVWLFAGKNHALSILDRIPEEYRSRVDILVAVDDRFSVLNLGKLDAWIKRDPKDKGLFTEERAQIATLRHFMSLQQFGTVVEDVVIVDEETADEIEELDKAKVKLDGDRSKAINATSKMLREHNPDATMDVNVNATGVTKAPINIDIKKTKPFARDEFGVMKGLADTVNALNSPDIESEAENQALGEQMEEDLRQLEILDAQRQADALDEVRDYVTYQAEEFSHTGKIDRLADELAAQGLLSAAEIRRAKALGRRYEVIPSPFDATKTLSEHSPINPDELKITPESTRLLRRDLPGVFDKSMMNYALKDFRSRYIQDVMSKDIENAMLHLQQAGIAVTDMHAVRKDDYLGSSMELSVQLTPLVGTPTTVKMSYPLPDKDGIFTANKVKYSMRSQRVDLPIRKVAQNSVALTSYFSKMFVNRTDRMQFNYERWLIAQINLAAMDETSKVSEVIYEDVYDREIKLPYSYTCMARHISGLSYGETKLTFNYKNISNYFPEEFLKTIDLKKHTPIGYRAGTKESAILYLDQDDRLWVKYASTDQTDYLGSLPIFLGLDVEKQPLEYAEVKLMGTAIPVVFLLGYKIGLGNLIKTTGVKIRRLPRRGKGNIFAEHEFPVYFEDEILVFDKRDRKAELIFNGLNRVKSSLRTMSVYSFDKPDIYSRIVKVLGGEFRHTKFYDLLFNVWVDHMTRELLVEMKEPTDLVLLFLSAIDKLADDQHIDPNAIEGSYIRGYRRFTGMMYEQLFKEVRRYNAAPLSKNSRLELNPKAVWFSIIQDQTVGPIEESNPIHSIKEKEVVVFRGAGGRGADSMTAKHRQFAKDAVGVVSEANVDNGSVGTVTYLTADPNIVSLSGINKPLEDQATAPKAKLQSTAMLISAGSDQDDSKRTTFTNVMFTSTTFLYNATPNRVQTGGERTIAYRTTSSWVNVAQKPGKVRSVSKKFLEVDYDDGTSEVFAIGRKFGTWSGKVIPHDMLAFVKVGDRFDTDDILTYNSHYFQPDTIDPKQVVFKRGMTAKMVMVESTETLEDACSVSRAFGEKLTTGATEKRYVKIPFDHSVEVLAKVGDRVNYETILCNLRPPMSGLGDSYSDDAQAALDLLNTLTPKADHHGIIDKLEVMYTGDIDNMSESLQEIVSRSDNELYRENKALGIPVKSAYVDPSYRINNSDITKDHVVICFYITETVGVGVGDKLVFGNQMKSIVSKVVDKPYVSEDGSVIDVAFSRQSIANRIVNSMDLIATTNTVLKLAENRIINAYYGKPLDNKTSK